ncbi:hypothetical protein [Pleurocapsa sp. PCC 7319]|uniref:hypothetical protein n=1 Tax=Pleurocapsa sp. PCC 7319 TaxID=118161 RepID=UPI0003485F84|nr:hypothetical protein [Pleurocapsa sp. PCC 7319]
MLKETKQQQSADELNNSQQIMVETSQKRGLYKYVWGLVGIWLLFLATFPVACFRVAQSEKFEGQPLKSMTWEENQKDNLAYPTKK